MKYSRTQVACAIFWVAVVCVGVLHMRPEPYKGVAISHRTQPMPSWRSDPQSRQAFITLYTGTDWDRVIALAYGLLDVNSSFPLAVAVTKLPDESTVLHLERLHVRMHQIADVGVPRNPTIQLSWHLSWNKLRLWGLHEHYDKLVYLDTDTLPLQNIDEMMDFPSLSIANGQVSPCENAWGVNGGVFVLEPSSIVHEIYTTHAKLPRWAPDTEQGFLGNFVHPQVPPLHFLSTVYNTAARSCICLAPNVWQEVKIAHFVATDKPWEEKGTRTCYGHLAAIWRMRLEYAKQMLFNNDVYLTYIASKVSANALPWILHES